MKITIKEILAKIQLIREVANKQLSVKAAYAIAKNIKRIDEELEIYQQQRRKLCDKYCEKDEKGNFKTENGNYVIIPSASDSFSRESEALLNFEVDLDVFKFDMSEIAENKFSAAEMGAIMFMLKDD